MKKSTIIFSAINLAGMLFYFAFIIYARGQAVMEERDSYDFGDSPNFILIVLPVLSICLLSDIIWAVMGLVAIFRRRGYQSALACVIAVVLWTVVILIAREMAYLPPNKTLQATAAAP